MVDKLDLKFPTGGCWSEDVSNLINGDITEISGWSHSLTTSNTNDGLVRTTMRLTSKTKGISVIGNAAHPTLLSFCPAKMVRANNVRLPSADDEILNTFNRAIEFSAGIAIFPETKAEVQRLDICLYVPIETNRLVQLFDRMSAPGFRKATYPNRYDDGGLEWQGSEKKLLLYNKALEQREQLPDARTRIELQLHGGTIARVLGFKGGGKVKEIAVDECYQALRRYLLTFPAASLAPAYNQDALVAHASRMDLTAPDGRCLLEWRLDGIADKAYKQKTRRRIEGMILECADFRWADYLPEHPTPEQWRQLCGYQAMTSPMPD